MSNKCPGGLGPGSESLQGRQAVTGYSGSCPRAHGVDQLSRDTRAWVRSPSGSTSCPGDFRPGSEGPRCRPAVPGDLCSIREPKFLISGPGHSRLCLRACGFDRVSRANHPRVRLPVGPRGSTGQLGLMPEGPRGRPAIPSDCGLCPKALGFEQLSRVIRDRARGPEGSTNSPR